jgi:Flp pilus assembly protein TadG
MKHPNPAAPTRRRRGAAAVELAITLPVLMLIVLGAIDFGRFAYYYIAVTNVARAGGAYGIMNPYTTATQSSWQTQVQQAAADEMAQMTGFDSSKLTTTVTATSEVATGLWRVQVTSQYPFKTIVNWPGVPTSNGTPVNLTRTVVLRAIRP